MHGCVLDYCALIGPGVVCNVCSYIYINTVVIMMSAWVETHVQRDDEPIVGFNLGRKFFQISICTAFTELCYNKPPMSVSDSKTCMRMCLLTAPVRAHRFTLNLNNIPRQSQWPQKTSKRKYTGTNRHCFLPPSFIIYVFEQPNSPVYFYLTTCPELEQRPHIVSWSRGQSNSPLCLWSTANRASSLLILLRSQLI